MQPMTGPRPDPAPRLPPVEDAPVAFPPVADVVTPHYEDDMVTLHHGDCLDVLRSLPDASVDAVVTDPPYGLEFMGKEWDAPWKEQARAASATVVEADAIGGFQDGNGGNAFSRSRVRTNTQRHGGDVLTANAGFQEWCERWARECLRVLKPGGHLLAFGGSRTFHRLTCAVEDAGFEVRDCIAWLYGSGFPKSLDVSKAIDKQHGAEREVLGIAGRTGGGRTAMNDAPGNGRKRDYLAGEYDATAPATDAAKTWQGWGTALKPAYEPVVVARKPLVGTVAGNVLLHGTGALNIDGCRTAMPEGESLHIPQSDPSKRKGEVGSDLGISGATVEGFQAAQRASIERTQTLGRWPTNVVLDDSQAAQLDAQTGILTSGANPTRRGADGDRAVLGAFAGQETAEAARGADSGGASRFFPTFRYEAKAPTDERPRDGDVAHPTVKPLDLMRWLVRLVTPPGGTVLEPFAGSGTTAEACVIEGFRCIAVEREAAYLPLIVARLSKPIQPDLFGGAA